MTVGVTPYVYDNLVAIGAAAPDTIEPEILLAA